MKKAFVLICLSLLTFQAVEAQRDCPSTVNLDQLQQSNPVLYQRFMQIEQHTQNFAASGGEGVNNRLNDPNGNIVIPVVVHIIHSPGEAIGSGRNLSLAQIQSQIDVLNEDYSKQNRDQVNTPGVFVGDARNSGIRFQLSCIDPSGNATDGITRTPSSVNEFGLNSDIKYTSSGGRNAWLTNRYLNIWVGNLSGTTLGFSTFPAEYISSPNTDGVVIDFLCFGRIGNLELKYNKGRTATHEVGHWLNLFHIAGDDGGACTGSDGCGDTPNQGLQRYGCPSFPAPSCGNFSDMFMNYMDYTDDVCMNIMTANQVTRMRANFATGGPRASFIDEYFKINISPTTVCPNGTLTFSLQNPTCVAPVWSIVSGSANIIAGQGTNQVTIQATGSTGTIQLRAVGGNYLDEEYITIGSQTVTPVLYTSAYSPTYLNPNAYTNNVCITSSTSQNQIVFPGATNLQVYAYSGNYPQVVNNTFYFTYPKNAYSVTYRAEFTNACGQQVVQVLTLQNTCYMYNRMYTISPNPSKGDVVITEKVNSQAGNDHLKRTALSRTIEVIVYDQQNIVRFRRTFTRNKSYRLPLTNLPFGVYVVSVKDGEFITTEKLSIEK